MTHQGEESRACFMAMQSRKDHNAVLGPRATPAESDLLGRCVLTVVFGTGLVYLVGLGFVCVCKLSFHDLSKQS